jgi:UDP-N-acetylmuramate: L-alanyl-gamma-D-glutamyl-meso-diaminopimelate ligase
MISWYDYAFKGASTVLIYKPATQGALTHDQLSHDEIVERVITSGCTAIKIATKEEGEVYLKENLRDGDVVLMMSSGTIGGLVESVPAIADAL